MIMTNKKVLFNHVWGLFFDWNLKGLCLTLSQSWSLWVCTGCNILHLCPTVCSSCSLAVLPHLPADLSFFHWPLQRTPPGGNTKNYMAKNRHKVGVWSAKELTNGRDAASDWFSQSRQLTGTADILNYYYFMQFFLVILWYNKLIILGCLSEKNYIWKHLLGW